MNLSTAIRVGCLVLVMTLLIPVCYAQASKSSKKQPYTLTVPTFKHQTTTPKPLPPVIVYPLTSGEVKLLAAVKEQVKQTEQDLKQWKNSEQNLENQIIQAHRTKEIGDDPLCQSPVTFAAYSVGNVSGYGAIDKDSLGYVGRIEGDWVVFSHDIPYCQGE